MTDVPTTDTSRERREIEAAASRLLAGKPLRSTGALTVIGLAAEANVKRWRLTHVNVDLMRRFQESVAAQQGDSQLVAKLKTRIAEQGSALAAAQIEVEELKGTVALYAQVIDDLNAALKHAMEPQSRVTQLRAN